MKRKEDDVKREKNRHRYSYLNNKFTKTGTMTAIRLEKICECGKVKP